MGPKHARRRSAWAFAALALALLGTRCTGGLREDEFECEQAVAKLSSCCPGFNAQELSCQYTSGCGETFPALTINESHCVQNESCGDLLDSGVCQRGQAAQPFSTADDGGGTTAHAEVCP